MNNDSSNQHPQWTQQPPPYLPPPPQWTPQPLPYLPPTRSVAPGSMFGKRLVAFGIDNLIVAAAGMVPAAGLAAVAAAILPRTFTAGPCPVDDPFAVVVPGGCEVSAGWVSAVTGLLMFAMILVSLYVVVCRPQGTTGQSIGMRAVGIKVVDAVRLQPIGTGRAIARQVAKAASVFTFYIGFLWMLTDAEQQTFHDKIADTLVLPA